VTLRVDWMFLSTWIGTTLGVSGGSLTNDRKEVLTAKVATNLPSVDTPASDRVSLIDGSSTRNTEAHTDGTDRRLIREVICTTDWITTFVTEETDDRSPRVKQRRLAARQS
jgi:hypothetical protein